MNPFTVVILSASRENVDKCISSIHSSHHPAPPIIVVADKGLRGTYLGPGVTVIDGAPEFSFSRNANIGIRAAGNNDVLLCNDDAFVRTAQGFFLLRDSSKRFGIVSPRIDGRCGVKLQKIARTVTEAELLAFVCVYIPRSTIDRIGLLDEQFEGGTWEDNDYCARVRAAGLKLGVDGRCTVLHPDGRASMIRLPEYNDLYTANKRRFEAKWSSKLQLSICVCSLHTRRGFLNTLMDTLAPQLSSEVELLLSVDDGVFSIGSKRQRLLESARGDFVVHIDDDDNVADDYVPEVLRAIRKAPHVDCITYSGVRYVDGVHDGDVIYSLGSASNSGFEKTEGGRKIYHRFPQHVTPIRRELALKAGFSDMDHGEDSDFAARLRPLLKTQAFIPRQMYHYFYRSNREGERVHK